MLVRSFKVILLSFIFITPLLAAEDQGNPLCPFRAWAIKNSSLISQHVPGLLEEVSRLSDHRTLSSSAKDTYRKFFHARLSLFKAFGFNLSEKLEHHIGNPTTGPVYPITEELSREPMENGFVIDLSMHKALNTTLLDILNTCGFETLPCTEAIKFSTSSSSEQEPLTAQAPEALFLYTRHLMGQCAHQEFLQQLQLFFKVLRDKKTPCSRHFSAYYCVIDYTMPTSFIQLLGVVSSNLNDSVTLTNTIKHYSRDELDNLAERLLKQLQLTKFFAVTLEVIMSEIMARYQWDPVSRKFIQNAIVENADCLLPEDFQPERKTSKKPPAKLEAKKSHSKENKRKRQSTPANPKKQQNASQGRVPLLETPLDSQTTSTLEGDMYNPVTVPESTISMGEGSSTTIKDIVQQDTSASQTIPMEASFSNTPSLLSEPVEEAFYKGLEMRAFSEAIEATREKYNAVKLQYETETKANPSSKKIIRPDRIVLKRLRELETQLALLQAQV